MRHLSSPLPANNFLLRLGLISLLTGLLLGGCVTGKSATPLPYLQEQADFFMQAGIDSFNKFNFELADSQFRQAENFYRRFADYRGLTHALLNRARVNLTSGNMTAASQNLAIADQFIQRHDLKQQAIHHDLLLTNLYLASNQYESAAKTLMKYDQAMRATSPDNTTLALLINRVRLAQFSGEDFPVWLDLLKQQSGHEPDADITARLLRFSAWQAFSTNEQASGNQLYSQALDHYRIKADPTGLMSTRLEWAQACSSINDMAHAAELFEQALHLSMANAHVHNGLRALEGLRDVYVRSGQSDKLPQIEDWSQQLQSLAKSVAE